MAWARLEPDVRQKGLDRRLGDPCFGMRTQAHIAPEFCGRALPLGRFGSGVRSSLARISMAIVASVLGLLVPPHVRSDDHLCSVLLGLMLLSPVVSWSPHIVRLAVIS